MSVRPLLAGLSALVALLLALVGTASSQAQVAATAPAAASDNEPVPKFDAAYLRNPANIKDGETVWTTQCRHCHGASAYPGKAPKINPGRMEPAFVFDRVTNGFQKMPAWKEIFTLKQRMAVVAYIKSNDFSP